MHHTVAVLDIEYSDNVAYDGTILSKSKVSCLGYIHNNIQGMP
jgi:hypothetical protein